MSRISVIIPCYNYGRYLRECATSALTQEGVDVEVLILDDASDDHTPQVADELAAGDPGVEVRRHERNVGHIGTYNEGLAWATGDYVVLLSADDLLVPGALARAAAVLDRYPRVGLVYGEKLVFDEDSSRTPPRTPADPAVQIRSGRDWIKGRCLAAQSPIASPEVMVRGSLQRQLGGYRGDLPHTADLEMWLRFAAHAPIARLADSDQAYYRQHAQSMHRTSFGTTRESLDELKACFDAFFAEDGRGLPDAERLHRMARSALAARAAHRLIRGLLHMRGDTLCDGEARWLWQFAVGCRPDASAFATGGSGANFAAVGWVAQAGIAGLLISLYVRNPGVRRAAAPALRALGRQPQWRHPRSVPQAPVGR